jgi:hypothetical protein
MVEASQRMITMNSQGEERGGGINNPTLKRHLELKIEKLQNTPRDKGQVKTAFESKAKEEGGGNEPEDTQRLVTEEIEMLRLYCVW